MRLFEFEVELIKTEDADLLNKKEWELDGMRVKTIIDLDYVCAVRQCTNDDNNEIEDNQCTIYLKSGESFICYSHSYEEVKTELLNQHEPNPIPNRLKNKTN